MNYPHFGLQSGWSYLRWYVSATTFVLLIIIPLLVLIAILVSPLTVFLWNSLMPSLFGFKEISWLQAVGLFLLGKLLLTK